MKIDCETLTCKTGMNRIEVTLQKLLNSRLWAIAVPLGCWSTYIDRQFAISIKASVGGGNDHDLTAAETQFLEMFSKEGRPDLEQQPLGSGRKVARRQSPLELRIIFDRSLRNSTGKDRHAWLHDIFSQRTEAQRFAGRRSCPGKLMARLEHSYQFSAPSTARALATAERGSEQFRHWPDHQRDPMTASVISLNRREGRKLGVFRSLHAALKKRRVLTPPFHEWSHPSLEDRRTDRAGVLA